MGRLNRDADHLQDIRDYYAEHRVLPSYTGLSQLLKFKAKNAAVQLAKRLSGTGYIEIGPGGRLVPGRRFFEIPRIDTLVPAGSADPKEDLHAYDLVELERLLIDRPSETVLLPIRGDSMIDAGILDGDVAVVRRTTHASHGDFVIAVVDGGYTLKELRFEQDQPRLVPHNVRYDSIVPKSELCLLGVVTGIIRRYQIGIEKTQSKIRGNRS